MPGVHEPGPGMRKLAVACPVVRNPGWLSGCALARLRCLLARSSCPGFKCTHNCTHNWQPQITTTIARRCNHNCNHKFRPQIVPAMDEVENCGCNCGCRGLSDKLWVQIVGAIVIAPPCPPWDALMGNVAVRRGCLACRNPTLRPARRQSRPD